MKGAGFCSLYREIHYYEIHYNEIWVYIYICIYTYFASPPVGSPKVEKVKKGHNAEDFSRFMIHDPGLEMGQRRSEEIMPKEHVNSEIDIKVKALSVILNHSNYEVAHAMVK